MWPAELISGGCWNEAKITIANEVLINFALTMDATIRIDSILAQISQLGPEAHAEILRRLSKVKTGKKSEKTISRAGILQLESLGAEVWKDMDVDRYVSQERQWE